MTLGKRLVQETLDKALTPIGFKRSGSIWTRSSNGLTQSVGLQKSQHGPQFYINLGIGINAISTVSPMREKDMHIRLRADSLFNPLLREAWVRYLDFDHDMAEGDRERELRFMIEESVVPQLEAWQSERGLRESMKEGDLSDALISAEARTALCEHSS